MFSSGKQDISSACVMAVRELSAFQVSVQLAILQGIVPSVPRAALFASHRPCSAERALFREPQQRAAVLQVGWLLAQESAWGLCG